MGIFLRGLGLGLGLALGVGLVGILGFLVFTGAHLVVTGVQESRAEARAQQVAQERRVAQATQAVSAAATAGAAATARVAVEATAMARATAMTQAAAITMVAIEATAVAREGTATAIVVQERAAAAQAAAGRTAVAVSTQEARTAVAVATREARSCGDPAQVAVRSALTWDDSSASIRWYEAHAAGTVRNTCNYPLVVRLQIVGALEDSVVAGTVSVPPSYESAWQLAPGQERAFDTKLGGRRTSHDIQSIRVIPEISG